MKRITLPIALVFVGAALGAQTPPAAPIPAPAPRPAIAPVAPMSPRFEVDPYAREEMDRARERAREEQRAAMEENRFAMERAREEQRAALEVARVDMERMREEQRAFEHIAPMPAFAPMPAMAPLAPMAPMAPMAIYSTDRFDRITARAPWAPGDAADSLYRSARDLLNRGDWGRAARMFADLQKNYPQSAYKNDSQYYEAYARYKIGTTDELRAASRILEPLASRITPSVSNVSQSGAAQRIAQTSDFTLRRTSTSDAEVLGLYARINGVLAQRGDSDAAAKVAKAAQVQGAPCDQEDISLRSEALNALSQMDPAQALPILRRVFDRKDECSASLRRNAVFILGRRADNESAATLMQVAKSDPNTSVRTEAINYLARVPGETGLNALEDMLRNEQDERIQRAAVRALMSSDNQRARSSMRALIDRKDAPINLRIEAINSFNSDRATTDDAAYLRGLFGKADNDQLKTAIINAVSRMGGSENDQWVIQVARNNNESSSVRANALSRLSRSPTITTSDLSKLYDASGESYEIRNRIISMLGNRKDQEATDKLIDIVKNSTVINHRTQAINALISKKDPRATQLLTDILDGKKP